MSTMIHFYTLYERLWHWIQAGAVIVLLWTGFEISYTSYFSVIGFRNAVYLHNLAGIIFVVNAFFALFYNLTSGLLKRYVPGIEDLFSLGFKHASYYIIGIFRGDPHPFDKTPEKRLLPLQKMSYFLILNVLLPLMVITGILKYSTEFSPVLVEMFGGLKVLGVIHRFGAWLFGAFVIVHLYMITTGRTIFSNLVTMITGFENVETAPEEEN